ncbi:MAG: HEPN domain-containing protein [Magnetococcales bacterium]|nr:HEPN domain-containing protein [Magnetococcales bacterium]
MNDLKNAKILLILAKDDLRAMGGMLDDEVFSDAIFGFHAQQAVEKGIKAWLSNCGVYYPKTHDIDQLLALMEEKGMDMVDSGYWSQLNPFAVQFRYSLMEMDEPLLPRDAIIQQVGILLAKVESELHKASDSEEFQGPV